ncbi:galactokinase [Aridibaculum aurantiacum]|uniref:galactokinase n=1 Tax=Aridibaculum aurantiacum TaxID=2810307 RepID=UPI001A9796C4|nr:galactokinase [Aridibaculum aurantiacum]
MSTYSTAILDSFKARFTTTPRLFFSPGRINLIGEHVDYNDGYVMPAAIDKGIWFALAANNSDQINMYSHDLQEEYSVSRFDIKPHKGWQNYLLGVINQVVEKKLPLSGFDCVFGGNLMVGAGLSSSAAVECGLIYGLNSIFHLTLSTLDMALLAQKAEHTYPGVKCGIMDQYASLFGKLDKVILLNCRTLEHEYYPLILRDYSLVLINSKVQHSLASGEYNIRRQQCEEGMKIIRSHFSDVTSFQEVTPAQVEQLKDKMDEKVYDRCLFVTQEIERTQRAAQHLQNNELEAFGKLMYETHHGLQHLYEVTCPETDFLVERAKLEETIVGSRQMGGGFGGCTINLIHKNDWAGVVQRITAAYKAHFKIEPEVYEVATSDGTYEAVEG